MHSIQKHLADKFYFILRTHPPRSLKRTTKYLTTQLIQKRIVTAQQYVNHGYCSFSFDIVILWDRKGGWCVGLLGRNEQLEETSFSRDVMLFSCKVSQVIKKGLENGETHDVKKNYQPEHCIFCFHRILQYVDRPVRGKGLIKKSEGIPYAGLKTKCVLFG